MPAPLLDAARLRRRMEHAIELLLDALDSVDAATEDLEDESDDDGDCGDHSFAEDETTPWRPSSEIGVAREAGDEALRQLALITKGQANG